MPGVILAVLDRPTAAAGLFASTLRLAKLVGAARINALLVRNPPGTAVAYSEEILSEQRETALRTAESARADAVRAVFDAWAPSPQQEGIDVQWIDVEAVCGDVVKAWGRRADYLVIEQPVLDTGDPSSQALNAALFASDRPVLVVPANLRADFGRRVAVAWRDDERTTRAVLSAVRCFSSIELVYVLAGVQPGAAAPAIPAILVEHNIPAELHVLSVGSSELPEALLDKARTLGADVLVMGAYVHNRIYEMIFGGVTSYMLNHAHIPILTRH